MLARLVYRFLRLTGVSGLWLRARGAPLRILEYHGVCPDALAGEAWMPQQFVAESAFAQQLRFLKRHLHPLPLLEAVRLQQEGRLPRRAVCLTLDDGYANNLHLAQPLLRAASVPATIFLATGHIESGELYPFDTLRLGTGSSATYKSLPIDQVKEALAAGAPPELTDAQRDVLRPLTRDELKEIDPAVLTLGAHTHDHTILANETRARRTLEIERSVELVREWTGKDEIAFAYPNGQAGDFDDADVDVLRSLGVACAVTTIHGVNGHDRDPLRLRRFPVSIGHNLDAFAAEVAGIRALLGR